jgi:nicotinate-nucleotide--dimethylbenzimidazole phosphoribosyltransferase
MVRNFLAGGAAINALARSAGLRVRVVDVGVAWEGASAAEQGRPSGSVDWPPSADGLPCLDVRRIRPGTANLARGAAMSRRECLQAVSVGLDLAEDEHRRGTRLLIPGEMGIANTTAASALTVALAGAGVEAAVGRGTGVDDAGLLRKQAVVSAAVGRLAGRRELDAWGVAAEVGGLEIACLAGLVVGAAARRIPVLLDGFISCAAALVAVRAQPRVAGYLLAAHRSAEAGHGPLLAALGLDPLVALDLRLGEGSGAATAAPLLAGACAFMREMATFESAAVSGAVEAAVAAEAVVGRGPSSNGETPTGASPAVALDGAAGSLPCGGAPPSAAAPGSHAFPAEQRFGVYRAIEERRDMRSFRPDPLPEAVLARLLAAAHRAPSVGYMQPWRFILVRDAGARAALAALVERERQAQALYFSGRRAALFPTLKVHGLLEAPVVVCVTVDPTRGGPHVLGRHSEPATDVYSAACAIENLWLAARAEGVGAGWVTFYRKDDLRPLLAIPPHVDPVALVCLGYVADFPPRPLLEEAGWDVRLPLGAVVAEGRWDGAPPPWAVGEVGSASAAPLAGGTAGAPL